MSKTPGQSKQRPISAFFTPIPKNTSQVKNKTPVDVTDKSGLKTPLNQLVGKRLRVYWPIDSTWYSGSVIGFDSDSRKHKVRYNDGDEEDLELANEKYEVLKDQLQFKTPAPNSRKRQIIDEDSGGEDEKSASEVKQKDDSEWEMESEAEDADAVSDMDLDPSESESEKETAKSGNKRKLAVSSTGEKGLDAPKTVKRSRVDSVQRTPNTALKDLNLNTVDRNPKAAAALLCKLDSCGDAQTQAGKGSNTQDNTFPDNLSPDGFVHSSYDRFPWLHPDQIRDSNGRKPNQEGYDPTTVHIPEGFFKKNNVTEGRRQWWQFKSQHYDAILLFKMGKFYELYEMDAHVGVEVLGIMYMKGDQPHCGFPEAAYRQYAEALARAGYKVVVVEQTETPEMLKARNERLKKARKPTCKVVQREKVAILTKGTLRDAQMVQSHPDPAYLMAIIEISPVFEIAKNGSRILGICAVDVASNHILFGQFYDDDQMANLRTHVAALQPTELLLPQGENFLSDAARKFISSYPNNPRKNILPVGEKGFMNPIHTIKCIEEYFTKHPAEPEAQENMEEGKAKKPLMPEALQTLIDTPDASVAVLHALGAVVGFLKDGLMDQSVIPLSKFERLNDDDDGLLPGDREGPRRIILDSSALENLEIIQSSEGESKGSLLSTLDQCKTPFGRRLLRQWLSRPLGRVSEIRERQKAVQDLTGIALESAGNSRKVLSGIGDLERALARLHTSTLGGSSSGRDADHVILYEDSAKRKVKALVGAIRGLESAQEAIMEFQDVRSSLTSELLKSIVTPGCVFPDLSIALSDIATAADWSLAEETGRVIPLQGKVPEYDSAKENVTSATLKLQNYLVDLKSRIGKQVSYVSVNKESHLVEVPDTFQKKVPSDFELVAQKKNCKRYMTPELRPLVKELDHAKEALEKEMADILQGFEKRLASQHQLWSRAIDATSQLDALMCLAAAALSMEGTCCCPEFVEGSSSTPVFQAKNLRHPCCVSTTSGGFVPNDVKLGGDDNGSLILLTGPNMGGKSTLIRQVCLATVLAQVGSFVPADSLQLSPVDAIFVRMGARDHILSNQSTFFVELSETAGMLRKATKHSLVALDELGRGTATSDGAAIASAVLHYVTNTIMCRGLFATHYHDLAREHSSTPSVAIKHMACKVTPPSSSSHDLLEPATNSKTADEVTFLYKLAEGACPKSYGTNVARLAGLPEEVVEMAAELSEDMERRQRQAVEKFGDAVTKLRAWKACGGCSDKGWESLKGVIRGLKETRG